MVAEAEKKREGGGVTVKVYKVSSGADENVLVLDSGNGCTTWGVC